MSTVLDSATTLADGIAIQPLEPTIGAEIADEPQYADL
jgi:hypothetical protein